MLMGMEVGRTAVREGDEGSASPTESFATDNNPPPSPCLDEDDTTPRQQWSPVYTVGERRHPKHTRGHNGGSSGGGTFAGAGERRAHPGGSRGNNKGGGSAGTSASQPLFQKPRTAQQAQPPPPPPPDSPVMRIDLERLDLSVLALGEEGGPTIPHGTSGLLHPGGAFRSEPGPATQGEGRPRSLGGRPSRVHALFVKPGQICTGPASPPSSYSTHSESGFASPTTRLASPFGVAAVQQPAATTAAGGGRVSIKKGKWKLGKMIGSGSCAQVFLGMNEDSGELMAVKQIRLDAKDGSLTSLYNEIQVMHKLAHPHIVGYLGAELQDSQQTLCIFQEWIPAGSLHSVLEQFGALSDTMTRRYTRQVLEGLVFLHANRVIHRDVKSKNILVDDRGNVKLADFGCALVLKDDTGDGVEMSLKGTPLFMAPEMILKRKCGKRVDVWSLGCAVVEMVTAQPPWADFFKHAAEIGEHFRENPGPPPLPDDLSPPLREFLLACFTWNASKRPTSHELGGHKYFRTPRPSEDGSGSDAGGVGGVGGGGDGDDNEIPLEAMGRAPFMSRMRRCSSATLPELLQRSQAVGGAGAEAFAAFGTAPSGTLRPPSPRYGPGGLASAHCKRTPTRRRVYTEAGIPVAGMPPPDQAFCGLTKDLVRRSSMPHVRSPPASPEKPRRPGRGSSPRQSASAVGAATVAAAATGSTMQHPEDDGRPGSGPIVHSRLRSLGDGTDLLGGNGGGILVGGSGLGRGVSSNSSGGAGRTDSEASMSRASSGPEGVHKAAPTPLLPPVVRELLGSMDHGGARGPAALLGVFPTEDAPPPTVLPLGLRRSASASSSARGGWVAAGGVSRRTVLTLQQPTKAAGGGGDSGGGGGGGGGDSGVGKGGDVWPAEGEETSNARRGGGGGDGGSDEDGGSCRVAQEDGK